jgi:hypothetical protein
MAPRPSDRVILVRLTLPVVQVGLSAAQDSLKIGRRRRGRPAAPHRARQERPPFERPGTPRREPDKPAGKGLFDKLDATLVPLAENEGHEHASSQRVGRFAELGHSSG